MVQLQPLELADYVRDILSANIYDLAEETPLDSMVQLSARFANTILLKREDRQPIFSFKVRGAYNMLRHLSPHQLDGGIIAASAGNHAQGVAYAANKMGIAATIVMPQTTPDTKVKKVRDFGAKTILYGDSFDDSFHHATEIRKAEQLTYIPPFDHPQIIAGQGTVAVELLRQCGENIDAIFVPVGGGGLLAGMTVYIKYLRPEIKIFSVEPEDSDCLYQAMQAGKRVSLKNVGLFADGVAVRQVGEHTFNAVYGRIDGCIRVSTDQICAAVKDIFDDHRVVSEPSGALALAGLKKYIEQHQPHNATLVAINSGANTNFERLSHIVERAQLGERSEAILAVTIPEKPGSFLTFCHDLHGRNITEFNYRIASSHEAQIYVGVRLQSGETSQDVCQMLQSKGYGLVDMSRNDLAITHVRHMVGGRPSPQVTNERIYRCVFPERPGALQKFLLFLRSIGDWNISLFHYRNHGAAYGRALVGIELPQSERATFEQLLTQTDYSFESEADNPAYQLFLNNSDL